jgi:hypothetical protein
MNPGVWFLAILITFSLPAIRTLKNMAENFLFSSLAHSTTIDA